ncbi:dihydropteroate synthase [Cohnella lubricantis]|uniref:Dihydropteroate synthase n=1 Tax=Cohnella lubricantis TaxID=2163172 RepID=A0A841TL76_9BACL|nr:dihydropteroate synthase [Cohnella lubricantis]MBB6679687.1 dihydropteroate synthase [Cohnella lubricantis]MBP2119391.1 dihydropteroate synthase [Cohnella lubricantis]
MRPTFHKRSYTFDDGLELELGARTLIMGILNVTPDSFSDGGRYLAVESAVERAKQMAAEGADLIDIGGESTRPGHDPVSAEEEIKRIVPVIQAVRAAVKLPISVDTYKPETARAAMEAGAHILNDIWGFRRDPGMAAVAAEYGCPVILMHNRAARDYADFVPDVLADLRQSIDRAHAAGVADENIWLDPGIGFAKDYGENLELMGRLDELAALGYPVLLATSRKTFIRHTLGLPADEVVEGTLATTAIGIMQGCQIVRVHDVKPNKRAAVMTDDIAYRQANGGG